MYVVWFFDYRYRIELEYNRTYCRFDFSIIDIVSNSNIVSNSIVVSNSTIALNSIIVSNSIYRSTSIRCVLWQEVAPNILRPIFQARSLHSRNSVGANKVSALETSRRELSEDVSFGITGTLLVLSSSQAWKTALGCVRYIPSYKAPHPTTQPTFESSVKPDTQY